MTSFGKTIASLALIGAASLHVPTAVAQVIKVGVVQTTTGGSAALYGIEQKNAIEQVVEQANASGKLGKLKIELVHYDDGADRNQTVNIFQRLIGKDKVSAILGPTLTTSALAADPLAQKAGIPIIASSNTAAGLTQRIGDRLFRVSPPEDIVTPGVIKRVVAQNKIKRVAQIYGIDDQLTKSAYTVQKQALADNGVNVVATETFQRGDVDFAAQLTKIKAQNPDAIVIGALAEEAAAIVRQARQLGIPQQVLFVGTQSAISTKFFELGGAGAEGTIVGTAWYPELDNPVSQSFVRDYEARYKRRPDIYAAYGHDAAALLVEAIRRAQSGDSARIHAELTAIKGYPGVLGPIGFDANREPTVEPKILVARGGKFVPLDGKGADK
ncbi:ABC transporter substrate-binding protein [Cupriavidus plantarum]|uniref:ABC transporter substrate-binding protein n=1 Tax=Cupriavidus plantarum TaxID=942865 RepID=UPI001B1C3950|nr:ABC transporter substrate-binding protein [Cupriavidus plantarum]CAG2138648.1 Leucine-specific-binding protein [Cupriavidus plantarum]SMR85841.1 amino acid/amide ABC transporter substrate-binding protein, HAAT family [Cupriavidus plantarum]